MENKWNHIKSHSFILELLLAALERYPDQILTQMVINDTLDDGVTLLHMYSGLGKEHMTVKHWLLTSLIKYSVA